MICRAAGLGISIRRPARGLELEGAPGSRAQAAPHGSHGSGGGPVTIAIDEVAAANAARHAGVLECGTVGARQEGQATTVHQDEHAVDEAAVAKPLTVHAAGVSIKHADVSVRDTRRAGDGVEHGPRSSQRAAAPDVEEAAVLSRCNRFEVCFTARDERVGLLAVTCYLAQRSGLPLRELRESLFI